MGSPWRTTEVYWAYLLPLMRAGTKATCCWLSAVQSQSCCVQTCWLLSAADFTDAVMGHREVSKGRRQSQIIHHDQETRGEIHQLNAASLAKVDLISYCCSLHVFDRPPLCLSAYLSACLPHPLRLMQTDLRAWNMQRMYQSQSANTSPAVYHSPG